MTARALTAWLPLFCFPLLAAAQGLPAPLTPLTAPDTRDIFRQARTAIQSVPAPVAPSELMRLANMEAAPGRGPAIVEPAPSSANGYRDDAIADYRAAFQAARALRQPSDESDTVATIQRLKSATESAVVSGLLNLKEFASAHDLARSADVPRAPLYDNLIRSGISSSVLNCSAQVTFASSLQAAGGRRGAAALPKTMDECLGNLQAAATAAPAGGRGGRGIVPPGIDPATPGYDPLALARECYNGDGSFPYSGVWLAVQAAGGPASSDGASMIREIFARVDDDRNPDTEAISTLTAIHTAAPQYDPLLVETADSTLVHLQSVIQNLPIDRNSATLVSFGQRLLALLGQIDSARAAEITTQLPMFAPGPASSAPSLAGRGQVTVQTAPDPVTMLANASAMPTDNDKQIIAKINSLAAAAMLALARHAPDQARDAIAEANLMVSDSVIATNVALVGELARAAHSNAMDDTARALLDRCLAFVDNADIVFDQTWANATPDQQVGLLDGNYGTLNNQTAYVYSVAAQVDYSFAVKRAQEARAVILKPAILLAVARPLG